MSKSSQRISVNFYSFLSGVITVVGCAVCKTHYHLIYCYSSSFFLNLKEVAHIKVDISPDSESWECFIRAGGKASGSHNPSHPLPPPPHSRRSRP